MNAFNDIFESEFTDQFIKWFRENSPLCGKTKTMEKICEAFPKDYIMAKQPYPPYGFAPYCNKAAILMNHFKDEGRIETEKKGRSYCYTWVEHDCEQCAWKPECSVDQNSKYCYFDQLLDPCPLCNDDMHLSLEEEERSK